MNRNVVLFAVLGLIGFVLYQRMEERKKLEEKKTESPAGGQTVAGGGQSGNSVLDLFNGLIGLATSVVQQTNAKSV